MRYHDHVGLVSHDSLGPVDVWREHVLLDGRGELGPQQRGIPELGDGGIKFYMRRIIEIVKLLDCFFGAELVQWLCTCFAWICVSLEFDRQCMTPVLPSELG